MPTIRYIPKCHLSNFNEYASQTQVELKFDVESALPKPSYQENVRYSMDGIPCITETGRKLEVTLQVYLDMCEIDNFMEFINSVKCGDEFYADVCDVVIGFRPGTRAHLIGNPNWSEAGTHGMRVSFNLVFREWGC